MEIKTNFRSKLSVIVAVTFCLIVYQIYAVLAILTYGDSIQQSIFDSMKTDTSPLIVILRILFMFIFYSNACFLFLPTKESLITIFMEYKYRQVSKSLEQAVFKDLLEEKLIYKDV